MTKYNYSPDSSMIQNIEYDSSERELTLTFNNGKTYTYSDVDKYTYDDLVEAKSAGQYFNSIKTKLKIKS